MNVKIKISTFSYFFINNYFFINSAVREENRIFFSLSCNNFNDNNPNDNNRTNLYIERIARLNNERINLNSDFDKITKEDEKLFEL